MSKKASIIVAVFNQPALTKSCLNAVQAGTNRDHYELIIVDNGSIASTKRYLEQCKHDGLIDQLIVNDTNKGCAAAYNQGIKASTSELVVMLHNDCIVSKGWLTKVLAVEPEFSEEMAVLLPMTNYANEGTPIQEVAIREKWEGKVDVKGNVLTSPLKPPTKGVKLSVESVVEQLNKLYGKSLDDYAASIKPAYPLRYSPEISSYCTIYFRRALDDVGGFDEDFKDRGYEDKEWFVRAQRKGYECWLVTGSYVHHFGNMTSDGPGFEFPALMKRNEQVYQSKVK